MKTTLRDFALYVRAKNAGPFWVTFDIFMKNKEDYDKLVAMKIVTPELISRLYPCTPDEVMLFHCDHTKIIKISIPRRPVQASISDKDMHQGQQAVFLANVELDI